MHRSGTVLARHFIPRTLHRALRSSAQNNFNTRTLNRTTRMWFPRRQVFSLRRLRDDLTGFQDAAEFDFRPSRFRQADRQLPAVATPLPC
jgi:hypothetical protein